MANYDKFDSFRDVVGGHLPPEVIAIIQGHMQFKEAELKTKYFDIIERREDLKRNSGYRFRELESEIHDINAMLHDLNWKQRDTPNTPKMYEYLQRRLVDTRKELRDARLQFDTEYGRISELAERIYQDRQRLFPRI